MEVEDLEAQLTRQARRQVVRLFEEALKKRVDEVRIPPTNDVHAMQRYIAETMASTIVFDWKFLMSCYRQTKETPLGLRPWWFTLSCSKVKPEASRVMAMLVVKLLGGPSKPYSITQNCVKFRWPVGKNLKPRGQE